MPSSDLTDANARTAAIDDFEDLFENAPCGYLTADRDGRIGRANRTFGLWTGYDPVDLVGRRFADLLPIGAKVFHETHLSPLLKMQGGFSEISLEIICADGSRIPVLVNAVERRDPRAQSTFIRFTVFKATDRYKYERSLRDARDNAEADAQSVRMTSELREQFIAVLGHDLRNPLAAIASGLQILGKEDLSDRGRRVLGLMDGSVVRSTGLIDNVLDFARGRLGEGIQLRRDSSRPLEDVLRQVVAELRVIDPARAVTAEFALSPMIECDPDRIAQLVSNLLGNALTHGAKDQPVRISAMSDGEKLEISIANGGKPISQTAIGNLFQPFFRGEAQGGAQGLGLGLYIASEIAKAHAGALLVASDEQETRFTFTMPIERS